MPRILVSGRNGQVGWELQTALAPLGTVIGVDIDAEDLGTALQEIVESTRGARLAVTSRTMSGQPGERCSFCCDDAITMEYRPSAKR